MDYKNKLAKIINYYLHAVEEMERGPRDLDFKATAENEDPHYENETRYYEHIIFYLNKLHDVIALSDPLDLDDISDFDAVLDELRSHIMKRFGHRFKYEDFNFNTLVGLYHVHKDYCAAYVLNEAAFLLSDNAELNKFFLSSFNEHLKQNDRPLDFTVMWYAECLEHAFDYLEKQTSLSRVTVVASQLQAQCDEQREMFHFIDDFDSKLEKYYLSGQLQILSTYKNFFLHIAETCSWIRNLI